MCGICGIFNLTLQPAAHRERIDAMSARLEHRGPDSQGKFELPHLALAIRRLSIIDLETGNQPLYNETGDITLVFNGEIYNYRELRQPLLERGHKFQTQSDGEVIAHLYEEKGPDFVRDLNGMFAIALWGTRPAPGPGSRPGGGKAALLLAWRQHARIRLGDQSAVRVSGPQPPD